jgi:hypothetical protein
MPNAYDRRRPVFLIRLAPSVPRTRQRARKLLLQRRLDKSANARADPVLDSFKPIVEKQVLGGDSRLLRGSFRASLD